MHITGKNVSAVLIGEDDWRSIEETLYLLSIKGMRDSIVEGMNTPLEALKDAKKLSTSNPKAKVQEILDILKKDPYVMHPPYEKFMGDLTVDTLRMKSSHFF